MTEEPGTSTTPPVKYHANWLCHACRATDTAAVENQAELENAIAAAHADKSPECRSKYIATLPHVHPH